MCFSRFFEDSRWSGFGISLPFCSGLFFPRFFAALFSPLFGVYLLDQVEVYVAINPQPPGPFVIKLNSCFGAVWSRHCFAECVTFPLSLSLVMLRAHVMLMLFFFFFFTPSLSGLYGSVTVVQVSATGVRDCLGTGGVSRDRKYDGLVWLPRSRALVNAFHSRRSLSCRREGAYVSCRRRLGSKLGACGATTSLPARGWVDRRRWYEMSREGETQEGRGRPRVGTLEALLTGEGAVLYWLQWGACLSRFVLKIEAIYTI